MISICLPDHAERHVLIGVCPAPVSDIIGTGATRNHDNTQCVKCMAAAKANTYARSVLASHGHGRWLHALGEGAGSGKGSYGCVQWKAGEVGPIMIGEAK